MIFLQYLTGRSSIVESLAERLRQQTISAMMEPTHRSSTFRPNFMVAAGRRDAGLLKMATVAGCGSGDINRWSAEPRWAGDM